MESLEASGRLGSAILPLEGCNCGIFIAACACPCPCPCIVGDIIAKNDSNSELAVGSASWSNHKKFKRRFTTRCAYSSIYLRVKFCIVFNGTLINEWISPKQNVFILYRRTQHGLTKFSLDFAQLFLVVLFRGISVRTNEIISFTEKFNESDSMLWSWLLWAHRITKFRCVRWCDSNICDVYQFCA